MKITIENQEFTSKGFHHKMIKGYDKFGLFQRTDLETKKSHFEVVVFKFIRESKFIKTARWTYPKDYDWGDLGWTYVTIEDAEKKYKYLIENFDLKEKKV